MPKFGESLNKISLKDLLNEQELDSLRNYEQFKTAAEKGFSYEKNELIMKLLDLVIDKFKENKDNTLVKCFMWAQKIIQENLEIKIDSSTFKNLEKMKEKKPSLKIKLGWFEEYSLLNKEEEIYKLTRKTLHQNSNNNIKVKESKRSNLRRNTLNPELLK